MIITIAGKPGSGKSTVAKRLSAELGYEYYYTGKIFRDLAQQHNMTTREFNQYLEDNPETDKQIDDYQVQLGKTKDNIIVDGRLAWHFIPHSCKLFLDVDDRVAAERIFAELQGDTERNDDSAIASIDDMLISNQQRMSSEVERFKSFYDVDISDTNNYDIIIDTTTLNRDEVFAETLKHIQLFQTTN